MGVLARDNGPTIIGVVIAKQVGCPSDVEWVVFGIVDLPPERSLTRHIYTCNFEMRTGLYKIYIR